MNQLYTALGFILVATKIDAFIPSTINTRHCNPSPLLEAAEGTDFDAPVLYAPNQIDILRKEANKRKARKALPTFFMPAGDSTEISEETLQEISNLFETNEIIEVRGISKDKKKLVFDMSYALAETIEDLMEKPVVVVEVKGFSAKLYSPFDDDEQGKRIHLRSSYKPGQWKRKPKAIRDNRGQIILDENGKSIKDVSE